MDLSLNADAALRAYLPPESWNGDAQHRFVFRTEEGDEEPLLARLAGVMPDDANGQFEHCVLLRPENAESTRIFVAQGRWCYGEVWMTAREASQFKWLLFERNLMDYERRYYLSRFCLKRQGPRDIMLRYDAHGQGEIYGSRLVGENVYGQGFDWHLDDQPPYYRQCYFYGDVKLLLPCDQINLRFLQQPNTSFQQQVDSDWDDPTGEISASLKWQQLNATERDSIAFHCQSGNWSSFRSLATLVLRVRLGLMNTLPDEVLFNDFHGNYGWLFDYGQETDSHRDEFLLRWINALMQVFQPDNINAEGIMNFQRPSCVCNHISDSDLFYLYANFPSQHELLEAQLQLREWANAHFSPEEANRLLSL